MYIKHVFYTSVEWWYINMRLDCIYYLLCKCDKAFTTF